MSDHFLVVIPKDPKAEFPETAEEIRLALANLCATDEARTKSYGKLQFIDCGEAFEAITCPSCESAVTLEQWHAWMDGDWHGEDGFHLHRHETPCCQAKITLDTLVYTPPQGFARWFVSARNQNRGPLSEEEVAMLERVAGIPLKAIVQMY